MKKKIRSNLLVFMCFLWVSIENSHGQIVALQDGDLLFVLTKKSEFTDAIVTATSQNSKTFYSHMGILCFENDSAFVLEAILQGVSKTYFPNFLENVSGDVNENLVMSVARLKNKYRSIIPSAVHHAKTLLGKPYDYLFLPNNDAYYCSELVWVCFRGQQNKPLFESTPMTFKDEKGQFPEFWVELFKKNNTPIPEGEQGTNPTQLSKSPKLKTITYYFNKNWKVRKL